MRIAMIGSGYVGLVSGVCFADFGHDDVCIDKDQGKIAQLEAGVMPIFEPGLKEIVDNNVQTARYNAVSLREGLISLLQTAGDRGVAGKPVTAEMLANGLRQAIAARRKATG